VWLCVCVYVYRPYKNKLKQTRAHVYNIDIDIHFDLHFDFAVWSDVIYAKHNMCIRIPAVPPATLSPIGPPTESSNSPAWSVCTNRLQASALWDASRPSWINELVLWCFMFQDAFEDYFPMRMIDLRWWRYLGLGWRLVEGYDLNGLIYVFFLEETVINCVVYH